VKAYSELEARQKRLAAIGNAMGILNWDQATMMASGAAPARAEVMAELSVFQHELTTDPEVCDLISQAEEGASALNPWQASNLKKIRRGHTHATAVSARLVSEKVRATSEAEMLWRQARPANDFKALAPKLEVVFKLIKEEADQLSDALGVPAYEALIDQYDEGRTEAQIDVIFDDLETFLPNFLSEVIEKQAAQDAPQSLDGPFALKDQRKVARQIMEIIGFPFEHGRLDDSHHPFCGGAEGDIRITSRYDEEDFLTGLYAIIHETGHALYENGLPKEWRGQPVGNAQGMTLHESQSLLLEMQAGRTQEFVGFVSPLLREAFPGGDAWQTDNLLQHYRKVERGLIRVDADEVTYPLHIILRYRLEKAVLAGDVGVSDLPGAWNELMQKLVGITPPSDVDGVMQDVHWVAGLFGYFPTYSLGAMTAAQMFAAAKKSNPDILPGLSDGNFKPLFGWLDREVRSHGSLYSAGSLIERATGAPLTADAYKAHVKARYLDG
jgi:carboxypeptidase Taq